MHNGGNLLRLNLTHSISLSQADLGWRDSASHGGRSALAELSIGWEVKTILQRGDWVSAYKIPRPIETTPLPSIKKIMHKARRKSR